MCATISSCFSGERVTTCMPIACHSSLRRAISVAAAFSSGVKMQAAPSKRSARACAMPIRSEPAIGCEPMKFKPSARSRASRQIKLFVLPTSVTSASRSRDGAICSSKGTIVSTGVQTTTSSLPTQASPGCSKTRSHQVASFAWARVSARRDQTWTHWQSPRSFNARAKDAPKRPGPSMVIC